MPGDLAVAVQVGEYPAQYIERLAHGVGRCEWPIVTATVALHPAHDADLGEIVLPVDLDVGVGLVVVQPYVEAGPIALDQLVFKDQCFELGVGDDPFKIGDLSDQPPCARLMAGCFVEIGAHPVAQDHRFADIDDLALGGTIDVDARPFRQGVQLLRELGGQVMVIHTRYYT